MITSLQNSRIKAARALQRRRQRERQGRLLIEGLRLVEDALAAGYPPEVLFYTAEIAADPRGAALLAAVGRAAEEVSPEVMASLTETVTPQGVVAVVPLPELPWPPVLTFVLVCDAVRDPGNLGTLLRAAAGAGVDGVLLPKGNVDVWSGKVLRAGMGAHFRLPLRASLGWEAVAERLRGLTVRLADVAGRTPYDRVDWAQPSALIVGGEAAGAGREAAQLAGETISIPLANEVESLNAAMAGSIILFEAQRQRRVKQG